MLDISNIDWEDIIDSIGTGKCILMIGPLLAQTQQGTPLHKALFNELEVASNGDINYYDSEQLFFFKEKKFKRPFYRKIRKFYTGAHPRHLYQQIARIPFDVMISISPDLMLREALEETGVSCNFQFYKINENPRNFDKPTRDCPLVYNLFGSIEDEDSLIFTHEDLFEFLFSILGAKQLPLELKYELQTANNFIFLGFDFEMWYMKLIARLFDLHEDQFFAYASEKGCSLQDQTRSFYIDHFKINFISNSGNEFIEHLYKLCQQKGLLRTPGTPRESSVKEQVRKMIAQNEIDEAITRLEEYFTDRDEDLLNDVLMQSGRYIGLQKKILKNTIAADDAELSMAQIRDALLQITDEIK